MVQLTWQQWARLTGEEAQELETRFTENGEVKDGAAEELVKLAGLKVKDHGQQQFSRARKETWEKVEHFISGKNFTGEDLGGLELLTAYVDDLEKKATGKGKSGKPAPPEITTDFLEGNAIARQWADTQVQKAAEERDKLKVQLESIQQEHQQAAMFSKAKEMAFQFLEAAGWDSGKDVDEATYLKRVKTITTILKPHVKNMKEEKDVFFIADDKGYQLKDDDANPISFQDWILKENPFGLKKAGPGQNGSPGAQTKPQKGGKPAGLVIKDKAQYDTLWAEANNIQKSGERSQRKAEISKAYAAFLAENHS